MKNRLAHLDMMRGLAALLVCVSHLRAFLLVDSSRVHAPGIISQALYFITGFGHESVVVFFVLSGYFVGGGVVKAFSRGRWSWAAYAIRRLTRLWIVLLPALLITLVLDFTGSHLAPEEYQGIHHDLYHSGPALNAPADWGLAAFCGNAIFLQTILTPVFGTNGPLWSLANEFWYYLLFPLLLGVIKFRVWPAKIASLVLALCLALWLPKYVLFAGVNWLLGVAVFWATQNSRLQQIARRSGFLILAALLAFGSLVLVKVHPVLGSDYVVGIAFAFLIAGLAVRNAKSGWYASLASASGETTYTLYLIHFPFLAFIFFTCFKGLKFQPDLSGWLYFLGLLGLTLVYTTAVWWCFERNTDRVRTLVEARLARWLPK